jgi:DNA polymerase III epsilon subunit-like protein
MYLAVDTETTGIDATKNNLLTACFILLDQQLNELGRLNLSLKHSNYTITIKAMEINHIDLIKHHYDSNDLNSSRILLLDFLNKHKNKTLFTLIGHNVSFDIQFIKSSGLLTEEEFNSFINFNILDTISIAQYLKLTGDLPLKQSISLINLCKYYGLDSKSNKNYHNAEYDIEMTIHLLKKFKSINVKLIDSCYIKCSKRKRID